MGILDDFRNNFGEKMDTYRDSFERFCDILPPNDKQQLKRRFYDESFYLCYTDGRMILNAVKSEKWSE